MAQTKNHFYRWLGLVLLFIILDQIAKYAVVANFYLHENKSITSFFNLTLQHNPGAAFSFLSDQGGWQRWFFTALALVVAIFILIILKNKPGEKLFNFALSTILSGAIGNVIDRLVHGYVIDFLDFHWSTWHYPSFNLADSLITIGVICLIWEEFTKKSR